MKSVVLTLVIFASASGYGYRILSRFFRESDDTTAKAVLSTALGTGILMACLFVAGMAGFYRAPVFIILIAVGLTLLPYRSLLTSLEALFKRNVGRTSLSSLIILFLRRKFILKNSSRILERIVQ